MENFYYNLLDILENWWLNFINNLPQLIMGLLIFFLSLYLARIISRLVIRGMEKRGSDVESTVLLSRIVRWTIIILGIVLALEQGGQDITALIAGLGVVGFTIGFALQDVSSNLVAGLLLLYQQPFDLGDTIKVAEYSGKVNNIDLRATEILTLDGLLVMIPNKDVFTTTITNYTRTNRRRVEHTIGVSYESDIRSVQDVILNALGSVTIVLDDPAPEIVIKAFGGSTVDLTAYYWYDTGAHSLIDATNAGGIAIKEALEKAGIDMPFPTRAIILQKD